MQYILLRKLFTPKAPYHLHRSTTYNSLSFHYHQSLIHYGLFLQTSKNISCDAYNCGQTFHCVESLRKHQKIHKWGDFWHYKKYIFIAFPFIFQVCSMPMVFSCQKVENQLQYEPLLFICIFLSRCSKESCNC